MGSGGEVLRIDRAGRWMDGTDRMSSKTRIRVAKTLFLSLDAERGF